MKPLTTEDRAVSTTLTFVLTLTIVTMLVSGLFLASSSFVNDQRDRAIRTEFDVLGQRLAADLASADRLVRAGDSAQTVRIEESLPNYVANAPYRITVSDKALTANNHKVTLFYTASSPEINVSVTLRTSTGVKETTVPGGDIVIKFDAGLGKLEVEDD